MINFILLRGDEPLQMHDFYKLSLQMYADDNYFYFARVHDVQDFIIT